MKAFHDLAAFQRAVELVVAVYDVTAAFPREERYGLAAQLRRAAVGVPAQIAEGQGRLSYGEWRQFLSQARGSLYEVEAEAIVANKLEFLSDGELERVRLAGRRTGKALAGLIEWVRNSESASKRRPVTQQPINSETQ